MKGFEIVASLRGKIFEATPPNVVENLLVTAFLSDDFDICGLQTTVLSILKLHPGFEELKRSGGSTGIEMLRESLVVEWFSNPLLNALLCRDLVADFEIEIVLSKLRVLFLEAIISGETTEAPEFLTSLSVQCFRTDFAYYESERETGLLEILEARLQELPRQAGLLTWSCYRPLLTTTVSLEQAESLLPKPVVREHILEPQNERGLAAEIRVLSEVHTHSRAVQRQYEDNPYPRWTNPRPQQVQNYHDWVVEQFGESYLPSSKAEILIAGAGTGRHPIEVALRHPDAQVLALDVSRSSLAYGARKARELGVANIEFAQGDLLALGEMGLKFDLIECIGVLHHLKQPSKGWLSLRSCLKGNGLLRIGYYSQTGRESTGVVAVRSWIAELREQEPGLDLRQIRHRVMNKRAAYGLKDYSDLYNLSTFRDLLCHVCEHRASLPELQRVLERTALKCVHFEVAPELRAHFRSRFQNVSSSSLEHWYKIEVEYPRLFCSMYRFYCGTVR